MIVSEITFLTLCGLVVAAAFIPFLYVGIKENGKKSPWIMLILLLIPFGLFTPAIYEVTDCGIYTKKVLLFPKGDLKLGMHNYVMNQSEHDLFFEHIVYGNAELDEDDYDLVIDAGYWAEVPTFEIQYLFEEAPNTIYIKNNGEIHYRLSCDVPNWGDDAEESDADVVIANEDDETIEE